MVQPLASPSGKRECCFKWSKLILAALVPVMIGILTLVITFQEHKIAGQYRKQEEQQALDLQRETIFVSYINDVSKLLLSLEDDNNNKTKKILLSIRAKTLTVLRKLDPERKKHLLLFLYESQLLQTNNDFQLDLSGADFNNIQFITTTNVNYKFLNLNLQGAYLANALFIDCMFTNANFQNSVMNNANFNDSVFSRVNFINTHLEHSHFRQTFIYSSNFRSASLIFADFAGSLVHDLDFTNANLISVNGLHGEHILINTVLPNGTFSRIYSGDLIEDGDAEYQCNPNITSSSYAWLSSDNSFFVSVRYNDLRINDTNTANGGSCCFIAITPERAQRRAILSQVIDLKNFTMLIDSNLAEAHFKGYFGVMEMDQVSAGLVFSMDGKTTSNKFHGTDPITKHDMQNQTHSLILRSIHVPIPVKTRHIIIAIQFDKFTDDQNFFNVMVDNLQLTVGQKKDI